jgi:hypothetical protein
MMTFWVINGVAEFPQLIAVLLYRIVFPWTTGWLASQTTPDDVLLLIVLFRTLAP